MVAYAGTGRTPFAADSPPATAARILTQPPDLAGLTGPLRDLVAHALDKEPADRPTARELLDMLLAGPQRPAATAAALAHQPELRAAAPEAQAATGVKAPAGLIGYTEDSIVTAPISTPPAGPPPRRAAALVPAGRGGVPGARGGGRRPHAGLRRPAVGGPAVAVTPAALVHRVERDGRADRHRRRPDPPALLAGHGAGERAGRLRLRGERDGGAASRAGLYKCTGPLDDVPTEFRAAVDVRLQSEDSCAGIWFRFRPFRGYLVRVCETRSTRAPTRKRAG